MHAAPPACAFVALRRDGNEAMTRHRILSPADYRHMRWKNGAGRTTEIASHPAGAALDAFDWRVSIADVVRDGPFSAFAGVDRTIVVLAGAGMRLEGGRHAAVLRTPYEPHAFSGDDAIDCVLVDGPVRDFNLMLRRGRATGEVAIARGASVAVAPSRHRLCHAAAGVFECRLEGSAPCVVAAGHTLLVEDAPASPTALVIAPLTADAVIIVARMDSGR